MGEVGTYSSEFYNIQRAGSLRSAKAVVPLVLSMMPCKSVVDIGCGVGTWLRAFMDAGVEDVFGIDGDYVDRATLEIPAERFAGKDLTRPLDVGRRFDLAISLEVAEHIPPECAERFVDSITALAPVVLFSAAIPMQMGADHVNEQWPDYWAARFAKKGYVPVDCIRRKIWDRQDIDIWYIQNTLMFVSSEKLADYPALEKEAASTIASALSIVHPRMFVAQIEARTDPKTMSSLRILKAVPVVMWRALARRVHPAAGRA